jgi:elongator complex protein 2
VVWRALPQVHGHDFTALALLPGGPPARYAAGSEEKVVRVLEAPRTFEATLALARGRPPPPAGEPQVRV